MNELTYVADAIHDYLRAQRRRHAAGRLPARARHGSAIGGRMKKLYLSGAMTGHPDLNFPAFHAAQAELHRAGFVVMNPARNGLPMGLQWHQYMRRDLSMLIACNGIALLPGWERSRGARLEVAWADALQMPVRAAADWIKEA